MCISPQQPPLTRTIYYFFTKWMCTQCTCTNASLLWIWWENVECGGLLSKKANHWWVESQSNELRVDWIVAKRGKVRWSVFVISINISLFTPSRWLSILIRWVYRGLLERGTWKIENLPIAESFQLIWSNIVESRVYFRQQQRKRKERSNYIISNFYSLI